MTARGIGRRFAAVTTPIERLPPAYARYLRLRAEGRSDVDIARALEVPPESLGLLDALARAKLERLTAEDGDRERD